MIYQNFSGFNAFAHEISTFKEIIVCVLSKAQTILWAHECQYISKIFCEKFLTVLLSQTLRMFM